MQKLILISSLVMFSFLTACSEIEPKPFVPSAGHLSTETQQAADKAVGGIPELTQQTPALSAPVPSVALEKYTVVVNEVPVKELLFALARDAKVNVDVDPKVVGVVTINAIEQTLPQILDRIQRQVDVRYELSEGNLYIQPDEPFFKTYTVDYINISREVSSSNTITSSIESSSEEGAGNSSSAASTSVSSTFKHDFWESLVEGIGAIIATEDGDGEDGVIKNAESGMVMVKATELQHALVQEFIDKVVGSATRQVLVQATIVEVSLSDDYQAGIDWSYLNHAGQSGIQFVSKTLLEPVADVNDVTSSVVIAYDGANEDGNDVNLTGVISLLDTFGETKVLSSPQVMTLNNQTALLKVVDNRVYFSVETTVTPATDNVEAFTTHDTEARTLPIGIVMTVTPHIGSDDLITLNVRPTISTFIENVPDPNPLVTNNIPQVSVSEIESILRLKNGQIGVLGGLMTNESRGTNSGLPGARGKGLLARLFQSQSYEHKKKELVIFLKPALINDPSLEGDLAAYRRYLD